MGYDEETAVRKSGLRFCFAGQGLRPPARGRPSAGGAQGVDEAGPEHPEILGLEPQFAGLRGRRGSFAPDVAQIRFVGRMLVGGKFGEEGRKCVRNRCNSPSGNRPSRRKAAHSSSTSRPGCLSDTSLITSSNNSCSSMAR